MLVPGSLSGGGVSLHRGDLPVDRQKPVKTLPSLAVDFSVSCTGIWRTKHSQLDGKKFLIPFHVKKNQVVQVVRNGERVLPGDKQREVFILQQKEGESGYSIIVDEYDSPVFLCAQTLMGQIYYQKQSRSL